MSLFSKSIIILLHQQSAEGIAKRQSGGSPILKLFVGTPLLGLRVLPERIKKMTNETEFKTGYSTSIKISSMQKLVEFAYKLRIPKADIGRRIIEYFLEHNDIEDLQA